MIKNRLKFFMSTTLAAVVALGVTITPLSVQAAGQPTASRTAENTIYYGITCLNPAKGTLDFSSVYYINDRSYMIQYAIKGANDFRGGSHVAIDACVNAKADEFGSDPVWRQRYAGAKRDDGLMSSGYQEYYTDMVTTYPQLQTAIKNGWNDLTLNGIQQLIANGTLPADALVGRVSTAGTATVTTPAATTTTAQTPAEASIAKLQEAVVELTIHPATVYNGTDYSKEFNAAFYYIANPDLQTAIGVNAKKLLEHYVKHGKAEGRLAIAR